jgi:hypothetical protein
MPGFGDPKASEASEDRSPSRHKEYILDQTKRDSGVSVDK